MNALDKIKEIETGCKLYRDRYMSPQKESEKTYTFMEEGKMLFQYPQDAEFLLKAFYVMQGIAIDYWNNKEKYGLLSYEFEKRMK